MNFSNNLPITEESSGLRPEILESVVSLAKKHDIEIVVLFGSRARGDYKKKSDIDLAVLGGDFSGFCLDVDEETPTLLKYDFVNLSGDVSESLLSEIEKDGRILSYFRHYTNVIDSVENTGRNLKRVKTNGELPNST